MRRLGVEPLAGQASNSAARPVSGSEPSTAADAGAPDACTSGDTAAAEELRRALLEGPVPDKDRDLLRGQPPRRLRAPPRRSEPRIDERLDLHGTTAEAAVRRLESFLLACRRRGLGTVLVITGRGRHSPGGVGVLRQRIDAWLRGPGAGFVAAYSPAPPRLGGDGAFLVHLRRR